MSSDTPHGASDKSKLERRLERALERSEERLADYERVVDQTQHLLNTRISEVETARAALNARTEQLEESEQRFRQLAEAAFEAILICDDGEIADCNDAASHLYGLTKESLVGSAFISLVHETSREEMVRQMTRPSLDPVEMLHTNQAQSSMPVEVRIRAVVQHGHHVLVIAVRDITEHKAMEKKLRRLASTDSLTGIDNRRHFFEQASNEYFRAIRYTSPLSAMMLDIDHFKRINDTHGHDVGDIALRALTAICRDALRTSDLFGRLGGEEFAILLPSTSLHGAEILANRLCERIAATDITIPDGALRLTVSLGLTDLRPGDDGIELMLKRADQALYSAKHSGRNQCQTL